MRLFVPVTGVIIMASCSPDSSRSAQPPTVTDSAGVAIVSNYAPTLGSQQAWTVDSVPSLVIGGMSANPDEEFFRVAAGLRLEDGRIVIANAGSAEIRFFDAAGNFELAVGTRGGGPGEFRALSALRRYGNDSLIALDGEQRRITLYDRQGNLGRMATLIPSDAGGLPFLGATFGVFDDGSLFLSTIDPFSAPPGPGASRGTEPTFRISATGEPLNELGAFPGREIYVVANGPDVRATQRIFGYSSHYAAGPDRFYVGTTDAYRISQYTPTGALQRIIVADHTPSPVTPAHRAAFMETRVADMSTQERLAYEARYDGNEPPATFPAFETLGLDTEGFLWVAQYRQPGDAARRYRVFDSTGVWITDVDTPDGASILEVGQDYVLAVERDELDVERIAVYPLRRTPA